MESTLSLSLNDLAGDIGDYLGYGVGIDNGGLEWTDDQKSDVTRCLKSGLRQFYYPTPLPGEAVSHDWAFLKPTGTLTLASGEQDVYLPDDYGGLDGRVVLASTADAPMNWWPVEVGPIGRVLAARSATPDRSGRPLAAALDPLKGTGPQSGQRWRLCVFPEADQDYTLQVTYYVNPDSLSVGLPYPLGGLQHAETIREACLMAAENFKDDASTVHAMKFMERLAASVNADRKNKPQTVGYNRDHSDLAHLQQNRGGPHGYNQGGLLYNGVQY